MKNEITHEILDIIEAGDLKSLIPLINNEKNANIINDAFIWASQTDHLHIVKYLDNNYNIDVYNKAFQLSANAGYLDVVKYLVEKGANIHENNDYALAQCASYDMFNIIEYLVEQGCDIYIAKEWGTEKVQYWAAQYIAAKELSEILHSELNNNNHIKVPKIKL